MNIDRPLDELIKESREAKRAAWMEKRKAVRDVKKPKAPNPPAVNGDAPQSQKQNPRPPKQENRPIKQEQRPQRQEQRPQRQEPRHPRQEQNLPPSKKRGIIKKRRFRKGPPVPSAARDDQYSSPEREPTPPPAQQPAYHEQIPNRKSSSHVKGVKVKVSNLHPGVTQADIAELFETVGPLKNAILHTHPTGESKCEAEVIFETMADALEAIKKYNMVPLDNQPLNITLATDSQHSTEQPQEKPAGRGRGRGPPNGRKRRSPDVDEYQEDDEDEEAPRRGNGYSHDRPSPRDDRPGGNGSFGRRHYRKRFRRYQNRNGGGNANGSDRTRDGRDRNGRDDYDD